MVPLQVLVADDEPVSRAVVGAILKKAGYPVIFAPDGEQAWQALDSDAPPSLAVLDWEMPGLEGPEIVERIRGRQVATPTYVILLTSRHSSTDIVRGLRAGADDYVTKPANEEELIARVNVGARVVQLQQALAGVRFVPARERGRAVASVVETRLCFDIGGVLDTSSPECLRPEPPAEAPPPSR